MVLEEKQILPRYIQAATLHGKATLVGDYKTANKQYKILAQIFKEFQKNPLLAKSLIVNLFSVDVPSVRIWTASHALQLNIDTEHAEEILKKYSADANIGILQLDSEMVLREWRKKGKL